MKIPIVIALILFSLCSTAFPQIDINNKIMLAQSFEQAGDLEKAAAIYEEAYSTQPQNYLIFESLNRVYTQSKRYPESVQLIEQRIKNETQDINLFGMLGTTFFLMGDEKKAFDTWDNALQTLPEKEMNYRVLANYALQRRAFEKAAEFFNKGKAISKNPELFSYDLANIYSLTMRFKEAAEEYCFILSRQPTQLSTVENRILTYSNKPGGLAQTVQVLEDWNKNDNPSYDYLLSRLYIESKDLEKAYSLYQKIDERQQNKGLELYNFAQLVFNEGEFLLASKVFEDIVQKYPQSPYSSGAKLGYAKTQEAVLDKEIEAANPTWKTFSEPIVIDSAKANNVVKAYGELIDEYPNSEIAFESYFRIGKLYFNKLNKIEQAKSYFERIHKDAPLSKFAVESSEQLGKIFLIEGDLIQAKKSYEGIINNGRSSEEKRNYSKYMLARINLFEGNFQQAKERLNNIISNLKDNTANDAIELSLLLNTASADSSNLVKLGKAEFLTEQRKFSEASEQYKNISSDPNAFILHHICKIREAEAVLAINNLDKSIELLNIIIEEADKNIYADKALYLLGKIYQYGFKNYPKAIESYESLLARFPNSVYLDDSRDAILILRNKLS